MSRKVVISIYEEGEDTILPQKQYVISNVGYRDILRDYIDG